MDIPQHVECDTPDCIHWKDGGCAKETSVTIQEHHCVDYEERIILPAATVTIEVSGGLVQNVYARRRKTTAGSTLPSRRSGICASASSA